MLACPHADAISSARSSESQLVRSHQAEEHPPDQLEQVPHGPSWPDSWPQAKWMGFATGTGYVHLRKARFNHFHAALTLLCPTQIQAAVAGPQQRTSPEQQTS